MIRIEIASRLWSASRPLRSVAPATFLIVGLLALVGVAFTFDGERAAARCATTTTLVDFLSESGRPSGAAAAEVCRRLRAGAIAPAELVDVVRSLWRPRLGFDQMIEAGETMNVSVTVAPPSIEGIPEPLGPRAPRLRWRMADVRVGDAPPARVSGVAASDGPLPLNETSAWQPVAFPAPLRPGPVSLRCRVDFELNVADGVSPTRWSEWLEASVTVVIVPVDIARR